MNARIIKRRARWRVYVGKGLVYAGRSLNRALAYYTQARLA